MTDYLHALPSGYRIEEYELAPVLGSGGFGITCLGYDHHLDKAVAIKEYLPWKRCMMRTFCTGISSQAI